MLDDAAGEREQPAPIAADGALTAQAERLAFAVALRDALARHQVNMPIPRPNEHVLLIRGVPVVPWIPLRPADVVWSAWLERLRALWECWAQTSGAALGDWETWRAEHIHLLHAQLTPDGVRALALLLAEKGLAGEGVHLVGHSVGGASALAYLAGLRAELVEQPLARLRSVITLDAAVAGIAGVWTGTRQILGASAAQAFHGLGAWAADRGIGLLTACNERDLWSHRAIADLPYVGIRLGPRYGTLAQINGRIHGLLRRTPQLVEAIWTPAQEMLTTGAAPLPPGGGHTLLPE